MLKGTALKVLLVEDNLAVVELIQELLLEANEVRVPLKPVKRVSEAIEALEGEDFDAILLDLSLPDGKWLDTIATLKEYAYISRTGACPPIVVLSAVDDEDLAVRVIQAGAQDYLVKGKFDSFLLIRSLRYAIARQDAIGSSRRSAARIASSEHQLAAEALQRSFKQNEDTRMKDKNLYLLIQQIIEASPNILYLYDLLEQRNVYANHAITLVLGYKSAEIQQMGSAVLPCLMHPDDFAKLPQYFQQFDTAKEGDIFEIEYRMRHANGEWRWLVSRDTLFAKTPDGKPQQILGIVTDISDRKLAEEALRQQKELLQTIFDHIPVMVTFYDAKGKLQWVNRELEQVLGWSLAELSDRDIFTFCYPNSKYRQKVLDFMQKATGKWRDFKTRTRDGRLLDTCWANIQLRDGTRIGIGSDITERKRAQRALQALTQQERKKALQLEQALMELQHSQAQLVQNEKMASLGQLVAGVAHEINNPISFIYSNVTPALAYTSDLLHLMSLYQQHYPRPPAQIQDAIEALDLDFIKQDFPNLLRSMQEGASRIREIVLSLRQFSRLDEAERKKADLHKGIDSTLMILQNRLKQPNRVAIQVIKEYGDLPLVECYPSELNQVFMNILNNAIDALEARLEEDSSLTPQIRIGTEVVRGTGGRAQAGQEGQGGDFSSPLPPPSPSSSFSSQSPICLTDKVVIHIADNGCGLPGNVQQRVFDPFFTTKPVGKGTGLGLSISHSIVVKKHNGKLYCNSQFGQGTEFAVELPL